MSYDIATLKNPIIQYWWYIRGITKTSSLPPELGKQMIFLGRTSFTRLGVATVAAFRVAMVTATPSILKEDLPMVAKETETLTQAM